ncbi:cation:proton antiporter [Gemmata sp. G18]|uniref:Cation:proton antiporter n=1 Tax=Gemmata palustris TaxID=2822762 RepID=A0ABS5BJF9_9BACT|nr:cation:proton antiporter [Gemmata palustris]
MKRDPSPPHSRTSHGARCARQHPTFATALDATRHTPIPARFATALAIVTPLCRRARLPAVVGLLAAGVIFGPYCLPVAPKSGQVAHFFAEIGKLLLVVFAGLEIDLVLFNQTWAGPPGSERSPSLSHSERVSWAASRDTSGSGTADRLLVDLLKLHRSLNDDTHPENLLRWAP